MGFDGGVGVLAGLVGGGAMMSILYMGMVMMPTQVQMNMLRLLGTMMLPDGAIAYMGGLMIHAGLSIAFALAHVGLYQAFGLESNLIAWGVLFGAVHWVIVGMGLDMMPVMHQGIKTGIISAPGAFALATRR